MEKLCKRCSCNKEELEFFERGKSWGYCNLCREKIRLSKEKRTKKKSRIIKHAKLEEIAKLNGNLFCRRCEKELPKDKFIEWHKDKYGTTLYCFDCRKDKSRTSKLKKVYNLSKEDFNNLLEAQDNKCLICDKILVADTIGPNKGNKPNVDHCHKTGKVRGLLCNDCNRGIGLLKDSKDIILKAYNYINKNT